MQVKTVRSQHQLRLQMGKPNNPNRNRLCSLDNASGPRIKCYIKFAKKSESRQTKPHNRHLVMSRRMFRNNYEINRRSLRNFR